MLKAFKCFSKLRGIVPRVPKTVGRIITSTFSGVQFLNLNTSDVSLSIILSITLLSPGMATSIKYCFMQVVHIFKSAPSTSPLINWPCNGLSFHALKHTSDVLALNLDGDSWRLLHWEYYYYWLNCGKKENNVHKIKHLANAYRL